VLSDSPENHRLLSKHIYPNLDKNEAIYDYATSMVLRKKRRVYNMLKRYYALLFTNLEAINLPKFIAGQGFIQPQVYEIGAKSFQHQLASIFMYFPRSRNHKISCISVHLISGPGFRTTGRTSYPGSNHSAPGRYARMWIPDDQQPARYVKAPDLMTIARARPRIGGSISHPGWQ
jgi:hypothetical protein